MGASLYRKRPVIVEAIEWTGENRFDVDQFVKDTTSEERFAVFSRPEPEGEADVWELSIKTLEGTMKANYGDFIIKGINGEFYPCKPDIFKATYELI